MTVICSTWSSTILGGGGGLSHLVTPLVVSTKVIDTGSD